MWGGARIAYHVTVVIAFQRESYAVVIDPIPKLENSAVNVTAAEFEPESNRHSIASRLEGRDLHVLRGGGGELYSRRPYYLIRNRVGDCRALHQYGVVS